jgi:hypothetical protein
MLVLTAALVVVIVRRFTGSQVAPARAEYSTPLPAGDRHSAELDDEIPRSRLS